MANVHPTKTLLLETAVELIDEFGAHGFTVDALLEKSKISKGSLYHHFEDFGDVVGQAQIAQFARSVVEDINLLIGVLKSAASKEDLQLRIKTIVAGSSSPERKRGRMMRASIISSTSNSQKFRDALAVEQQGVTDSLADVLRELQERGWANKALDPQALSTFLQAYSLGLLLNDVALTPVENEAWVSTVTFMLSGAITD